MKRNKALLLSVFLLSICTTAVHAQESHVAAGGEATSVSGTGMLSYSIGQVFYISETGPDGTVSQGVQQAYEIYSILGIDHQNDISLEFGVFPNPTTDFLTLDINGHSAKHLTYVLFDVTGKVISSDKLKEQQTVIEMRDLPASTYFLRVSDRKDVIGAFKVIKK